MSNKRSVKNEKIVKRVDRFLIYSVHDIYDVLFLFLYDSHSIANNQT